MSQVCTSFCLCLFCLILFVLLWSSFVVRFLFRFATEIVPTCDTLVLWHSTSATMYYGRSTSSRVAEGDRNVDTKTSNPYANRGQHTSRKEHGSDYIYVQVRKYWVERPTHVGVGTPFISLGSGAQSTSYHDTKATLDCLFRGLSLRCNFFTWQDLRFNFCFVIWGGGYKTL